MKNKMMVALAVSVFAVPVMAQMDAGGTDSGSSEDGGKTWEVNWITDQTRIDEAPVR